MSFYEERLERDLQEIRSRVRGVSDRVEAQVRDAVQALLTHDEELASRVILGDRAINRETRSLDRLCHAFVVRHLPVASHLRFVSSVLRLDVALERVGDYAVTICRHSLRCSAPPPPGIARDIELLGQQARHALAEAIRAFHQEDVEGARAALGVASQVDATHDKAFEDLASEGENREWPIRDIFGYLRTLYVLLRVADQAENIARETLFAVAGETKDPKFFRILFVDRANDCLSQIAEAYGRKAFPDSASFDSAGWDPAWALRPGVPEFLDQHALSSEGLAPKLLPDLTREPRHYHVVIGLEEGARERIGLLPFKTVFLDWELGPCPAGPQEAGSGERLEKMERSLALRLRELMEALRGADAL